MFLSNRKDIEDLKAYRALGTVEEVAAIMNGRYPDDDSRAPLPWSDDPAEYAAQKYGESWDD